MKQKLLKALLYISVVVLMSIPFSGVVNTLLKNNFNFVWSAGVFFGKDTFLIASIIIVVFLCIPLFYLCKKYITSTGTSVDKVTKSKNNLHGSSRFLEKKELDKIYPVAELNSNNYKAGLLVNSYFKNNKLFGNISYKRHCLTVGTSGVGKTTYFLEPTVQFIAHSTDKPSLVFSDPKGELYEKESGVLSKLGYDVKKLDLRNPENSLRFNPLSNLFDDYQGQLNEFRKVKQHDEVLSEYVKEHTDLYIDFVEDKNTDYWFEYDGYAYDDMDLVQNAIERTRRQVITDLKDNIKQIASSIVPQERNSEAMWCEGARSLISSVIWGLLEDSEIPDLNITKEMVTLNQISYILASEEDYLMDFINNRPATSNAKNLGSQYANNKAESMRDSFKSMAITFLNKLNGLEYLLGENEFDFTEFTSKPTAIFLIIPDESDTRYSIATMFISLLYTSLTREASMSKDSKLQREVFFLLDEFANLPKFENIAKWISISRSRGIYFLLMIQSLGQLIDRYGQGVTSTIQTQCQLNVYLGTTDKETQKYYEYQLGTETVRQRSISAKSVTGETNSASENLTGKPLVRTDELGRIKPGEAYIMAFQEFPAKTNLIPIFYPSLDKYKGYKAEFLIEKTIIQRFKPKHFDLSSLAYNLKLRYELFNNSTQKKKEEKPNIEEELISVLENVDESKKQAILGAFTSKKYSLVASNLRDLETSGTIDNIDDLINKIKKLKK